MITMSDDFKKSVSATEREMKGYVEVAYMSTGDKDTYVIDNEPEILAINGTNIDDRQLLDNDRKGRNYASLEEDYFLLDGTFVLPNNVYNKNPGMGYVSKYTYATQQEEITDVNPFHITCNATDCSGITVYFKNNRPLDLEFRVNTSDGLFTYTDIDITDNGVASVTFNKTTVTDLYIVVNDVLYPNRRLRLQEVDFGLSAIYEGEDLISFKTIEQCDRLADEISINECDVVLGDYAGKFDVNNPNNITKYLGENVLIKPYVGVLTEDNAIEYCTLGMFWLREYKSEKGQVTFVGKDIFEKTKINDYYSYYGKVFHNTAGGLLYYADTYFIEDYGVKVNNTLNDEDLINSEFLFNISFSELVELKDTLQKIAILTGHTFIAQRDGTIKTANIKNNEVLTSIKKDNLNDYATIDNKNQLKDIKIIKKYFNLNEQGTRENLINENVTIDGEKELIYIFGDYKNLSLNISVVEGETKRYSQVVEFSNSDMQHWSNNLGTTVEPGIKSYLAMKLKYNGTLNINISGFDTSPNDNINTYNFNETGNEIEIQNEFITYTSSDGEDNYQTKLQQFIDTLAEYRYNNQSTKKLSCKFNGNPAIECGDCIEVENKYLDENDKPRYDKIWVTKIESEFNGSFNQTIEGDILE